MWRLEASQPILDVENLAEDSQAQVEPEPEVQAEIEPSQPRAADDASGASGSAGDSKAGDVGWAMKMLNAGSDLQDSEDHQGHHAEDQGQDP